MDPQNLSLWLISYFNCDDKEYNCYSVLFYVAIGSYAVINECVN